MSESITDAAVIRVLALNSCAQSLAPTHIRIRTCSAQCIKLQSHCKSQDTNWMSLVVISAMLQKSNNHSRCLKWASFLFQKTESRVWVFFQIRTCTKHSHQCTLALKCVTNPLRLRGKKVNTVTCASPEGSWLLVGVVTTLPFIASGKLL